MRAPKAAVARFLELWEAIPLLRQFLAGEHQVVERRVLHAETHVGLAHVYILLGGVAVPPHCRF